MKRNTKKLLSLLLSASMAFSVWTMPVYATQTGDATEDVVTTMPEEQNGQDNDEIVQNVNVNESQEEEETEQTQEVTEEPQNSENVDLVQEETEVVQNPVDTEPQEEIKEQEPQQLRDNLERNGSNSTMDTFSLEDYLADFTIDASNIKVPHINVND